MDWVRKVDDDEIAVILASLSPQEAAQSLVDLANIRGGPDNCTVIIVRIAEPDITTRASHAPPLSVQRGEKAKPIHPMFIMAVVVCFLAVLVLGFIGQFLAAGVAGLAHS